MAKNIESVETKDGVTTITYEDGSVEVRTDNSTIHAGRISGGVHMN